MRSGLAAFALLSASAAQAACGVAGQTANTVGPRLIKPEDLVRLHDIGGFDSSLFGLPSPMALSPDGRMVAFVESAADPETNSYCRKLVVLDLGRRGPPRVLDSGGELIQLRYDLRGLLAEIGYPDVVVPAWSPDGRSLGYLRRDGGVTRLWAVPVVGGPAHRVSDGPVDAEAWVWTGPNRVVVASRTALLDAERSIASEGRSGWIYDARWSPEYAARPQLPGSIPREYRAYDVHSGQRLVGLPKDREAVEPERVNGLPARTGLVSTRGRAWLARDGGTDMGTLRLHLQRDAGPSSECRWDQCAGSIDQIFWTPGRDGVVYVRREGWAKGEMGIYVWHPERGAPRRILATKDVLLGCLSRGASLVCLRESSTHPRRVVEIDLRGRVRLVYEPNPAFASFRLGEVHRLTWTNDRGLPAWGDLVLPPSYHRGDKVPLIVVQYHSDGFLRGGTGDEYPVFPFAAKGMAVLNVERPAFVQTFGDSEASVSAAQKASMEDWAERRSLLSSILTGVDQVVRLGVADPGRIGITGLSDGATTARFALLNSRVFAAAAISQASFEPLTTMVYGGPAWAEYNRTLGFPPATRADPKFWKPMSIAMNAASLDTPVLIQASDDEYLLALESYTALREQGKPVEMYVFPGEHHIKWQPEHRLAVYRRSIDWFGFWLQGREDPDPAKAAQFARWRALLALQPTAGSHRPSVRP